MGVGGGRVVDGAVVSVVVVSGCVVAGGTGVGSIVGGAVETGSTSESDVVRSHTRPATPSTKTVVTASTKDRRDWRRSGAAETRCRTSSKFGGVGASSSMRCSGHRTPSHRTRADQLRWSRHAAVLRSRRPDPSLTVYNVAALDFPSPHFKFGIRVAVGRHSSMLVPARTCRVVAPPDLAPAPLHIRAPRPGKGRPRSARLLPKPHIGPSRGATPERLSATVVPVRAS